MKERKMILRRGVPAVPSPDAGFLYFTTQRKFVRSSPSGWSWAAVWRTPGEQLHE